MNKFQIGVGLVTLSTVLFQVAFEFAEPMKAGAFMLGLLLTIRGTLLVRES